MRTRPARITLRVVVFHLSDAFRKDYSHIKQKSISTLPRAKQYIIPNYPLPPKEEKTDILRVVVRESMSLDLPDRLITDIIAITEQLMDADPLDLAALQPGAATIEKQYQSKGVDHAQEAQGRETNEQGSSPYCLLDAGTRTPKSGARKGIGKAAERMKIVWLSILYVQKHKETKWSISKGNNRENAN